MFAYLQECPAGTYKNATGSDGALCHHCPAQELPHRAVYIAVRGTFMLMVANFILFFIFIYFIIIIFLYH